MQRSKQLIFGAFCVCALACLQGATLSIMPPVAQAAVCSCADCDGSSDCDADCTAECCEVGLVCFADYRKIDLNTATQEQLCLLSGIGEVKAGYIIEYRVLVGAFESVQDVTNVSGITQQMVEEWGDEVFVSPVE